MSEFGDHGGTIRPRGHEYNRGRTSGDVNRGSVKTSFPGTTFGSNDGSEPNASRDVISKPSTRRR